MGDPTKYIHLYEVLPTALARCINAHPIVPAANAHHTIAIAVVAIWTVDIWPNTRVRDKGVVPIAVVIVTSQQHTGGLSLLFLELKGLPQPKFQRAGAVGRRPIGAMSDAPFHKRNRLRVPEVRN